MINLVKSNRLFHSKFLPFLIDSFLLRYFSHIFSQGINHLPEVSEMVHGFIQLKLSLFHLLSRYLEIT